MRYRLALVCLAPLDGEENFDGPLAKPFFWSLRASKSEYVNRSRVTHSLDCRKHQARPLMLGSVHYNVLTTLLMAELSMVTNT